MKRSKFSEEQIAFAVKPKVPPIFEAKTCSTENQMERLVTKLRASP
jgi:hypothetical protein